eukprot:UC4_evm1s400
MTTFRLFAFASTHLLPLSFLISTTITTVSASPPSWTMMGSDIDGEAAGDQSGISVSLSSDGTRVAIGAPRNDADGKPDAGHARVYEYKQGAWTMMGSDIDGEAANDWSGYSVSLSSDGTCVAVGAGLHDADGKYNAGRARVYEYKQGAWTMMGSDIDGEATDDRSGCSVSLSSDGTRVAVGAHYNDADGKSNTNHGHARVYEYQQ